MGTDNSMRLFSTMHSIIQEYIPSLPVNISLIEELSESVGKQHAALRSTQNLLSQAVHGFLASLAVSAEEFGSSGFSLLFEGKPHADHLVEILNRLSEDADKALGPYITELEPEFYNRRKAKEGKGKRRSGLSPFFDKPFFGPANASLGGGPVQRSPGSDGISGPSRERSPAPLLDIEMGEGSGGAGKGNEGETPAS